MRAVRPRRAMPAATASIRPARRREQRGDPSQFDHAASRSMHLQAPVVHQPTGLQSFGDRSIMGRDNERGVALSAACSNASTTMEPWRGRVARWVRRPAAARDP